MSDTEYTPTLEEIREYVEVGGEPRPWDSDESKDAARVAAFDRGLAAHVAVKDRQIAELTAEVQCWKADFNEIARINALNTKERLAAEAKIAAALALLEELPLNSDSRIRLYRVLTTTGQEQN